MVRYGCHTVVGTFLAVYVTVRKEGKKTYLGRKKTVHEGLSMF